MIVGYVGTPGSGKTYEAICFILDQLRKGRVVFSNIDGLNDIYCRELIKSVCQLSDLALTKQLQTLAPDQLEDFWNHISPGALVVIDEVQLVFSARDWQSEKNKNFGNWASVHRKLGFDVVLITQNPERVESSVRGLFEWTYLFRKVNFFGGAVQKKYIQYSYAGDDTHGKPLAKNTKTYDDIVFKCYKSYMADDIKEVDIKNVNVLKHPIIYAIPVVLGITLYMFFTKSSFSSGDLFGSEKVMEAAISNREFEAGEDPDLPTPVLAYSKHIKIKAVKNGIKKYSNR